MRLRKNLALSALFFLIAACGSDDGAPATTAVVTTEAATTTEAPPPTAEPTTTAEPITTTTEPPEPEIDLEAGLLAHYPLDGDAANIGPWLMTGVIEGAVAATDRTGDASGALGFDGVDDSVVLDVAGLALGGTFSITMWLQGDPESDHQWVVLSDHIAGQCQPETPSWILRYNTEAGVFFSVYDTTADCGTHYGYASPILFDDDLWHHIALTAADGALRTYFDCTEVLSADEGIDLPDGPLQLMLGNQGNSPETTAFDGALDDLRFYDRALEANEVSAFCG